MIGVSTTLVGLLGLEPEKLLNRFGLIGLILIVFAESGLLIGFFLPGDSLLFTAGLLIATDKFDAPIVLAVLGVIVAAIVGDQVGYRFGKKIGPALFNRPKSRVFDPKNALKAQGFFDKYGVKTIVMARFVPIVRTFAPVVAGVGSMPIKTFTKYNVVGGVLWGGGVTMIGYLLGNSIPGLEKRIDLIAILIVFVSVTPILLEIRKERSHKRATSTS